MFLMEISFTFYFYLAAKKDDDEDGEGEGEGEEAAEQEEPDKPVEISEAELKSLLSMKCGYVMALFGEVIRIIFLL